MDNLKQPPFSRNLCDAIAVEQVIGVLNEAVEVDPEAMKALVENRVPCNKLLANHPTIQVKGNGENAEYSVGFLGLLNGFFGIAPDGYGAIAAIFDDDGKLTEFKRIR